MQEMATNTTKTYYELHLPIDGFDIDRLSGLLHQSGCLGIRELDAEEWIVYLPGEWNPEQLQNLMVSLHQNNPGFDPRKAQFEKLPYSDWNSEWRKYFTPVEIVKNLWVRPPWENLPAAVTAEEIIIDPQMAFGTGHHETTRLMMQAMQKLNFTEKQVLDLGTGSGILALFARKLGASHITGIDIDPEAIANATHNLALNKIDHVDYFTGDISLVEGKAFPIILANIQFNVLSKIGGQLFNLLNAGGKLITSGLLTVEDTPRLTEIYQQAGLQLLDQITLNEWAAITWQKPA